MYVNPDVVYSISMQVSIWEKGSALCKMPTGLPPATPASLDL